MNREQFFTSFGIDAAAATRALDDAAARDGHDQPWYVETMLAIGSWVSALAIIALAAFFLELALDLNGDNFGVVLALIGAAVFTVSLALLRRRGAGTFATHFTIALAAAGQAMAVVGVGIVGDSIWPAVAVATLCAAIVAGLLESRSLQALSSAAAVIVMLIALEKEGFAFTQEAAALCVAAGVLLLFYPVRRNLYPTAVVLLLAGPIFSIAFDYRYLIDPDMVTGIGDWFPKAIFVGLTLFLLSAIWRRIEDRTAQIELALFAAAAVAVSLLLPVGGAAALVIMVLAFILGERLLALLGVLLQAYFLWKFYYDLDMTLLNKSYLLAGVGVVLLVLWGLMIRLDTTRGEP